MRVSDDRYTRDRQRLDLALRLIRHEARTFTIRQWTGLSDDRIRKLWICYLSQRHRLQRFWRDAWISRSDLQLWSENHGLVTDRRYSTPRRSVSRSSLRPDRRRG
jgi:hypothetical protein